MKQTAVEWLSSKLSITFQTMYIEEIEQAKAMEKEHIISAWLCGENDGSLEPKAFVELAEQYYNETYNK
jgi:hypothetical protein